MKSKSRGTNPKRGKWRRVFSVSIAALCLTAAFAFFGCEGKPHAQIKDPDPEEITVSSNKSILSLGATDALGRTVSPVADFSETRQVGLFYFLWTGEHGSTGSSSDGHILDVAKLSVEEIKSASDIGRHHYWNEPLYGYYRSDDPWVFRKHLELFSLAGVDYLVFDYTNANYTPGGANKPNNYYKDVTDVLFPVAAQMQAQGWKIPKFTFMINHTSTALTELLLQDYYSKEEYKNLWYRAKDGLSQEKNTEGKPWLICGDTPGLAEDIKNQFYFKKTQWPNEAASSDGIWDFQYKDDGFPWMSWERVKDGARKQYSHNGIMSVSIAQHVNGAFSDAVLNENSYNVNFGRGWSSLDNNGYGANSKERVSEGTNFQEQWDYAIAEAKKGNVNNIFVTGWNEWVAQKQPAGNGRGTSYLVDLYDDEFSRDAEMSAGPLGDNFYMQLVENIRTFKGIPAASSSLKMQSKSVDIEGSLGQWDGVAGFGDYIEDTAPRDHASSNRSLPDYVNKTGRNDIVNTRVVYDSRNVTFLVTCAEAITEREAGDETWMNLLLSVSAAEGENWNGYHYAINRRGDAGTADVDRLSANGESAVAGKAKIRVDGQYLVVQVPRSVLDLEKDNFTLQFKVSDHVTGGDILDYYRNGDAAPIGRFNYTVKG